MLTHNFKNILKLLKNSVEAVEITCIDTHNLCIEQEDEYHHELKYKFNIKSDNSLTPNCTYQVCLKQLLKHIKNSSKTETIYFTDDSNYFHIRLTDTLTSTLSRFPLLYKQKQLTVEIVSENDCLLISTNTLNMVLKSIINTSDFYIIVVSGSKISIENIDAVIKSNITISGLTDVILENKNNIISNTCIQRISKIPVRLNIHINSTKLQWTVDDINTIITIL